MLQIFCTYTIFIKNGINLLTTTFNIITSTLAANFRRNFIEDAKILEGISSRYHSLPEEAHSSNKYIKLNPDGSFRELRIYGDDHYLHLEIGYHRERNIPGGKSKKVLHYHEYGKDFSRTEANSHPMGKENRHQPSC